MPNCQWIRNCPPIDQLSRRICTPSKMTTHSMWNWPNPIVWSTQISIVPANFPHDPWSPSDTNVHRAEFPASSHYRNSRFYTCSGYIGTVSVSSPRWNWICHCDRPNGSIDTGAACNRWFLRPLTTAANWWISIGIFRPYIADIRRMCACPSPRAHYATFSECNCRNIDRLRIRQSTVGRCIRRSSSSVLLTTS